MAPLPLFVFGPKRIVPVRITEMSITEEAFDAKLNPMRAKVSLGLRVLTVDDLGFDAKGGQPLHDLPPGQGAACRESAGRQLLHAWDQRHRLKGREATHAQLQLRPTSRYYETPTKTMEGADGENLVYVARRFCPPGASLALLSLHTVVAGERLDIIAGAQLGDPEAFWRIGDANDAMRPDDLTAEIGRTLRITLPPGVPGRRSPEALHGGPRCCKGIHLTLMIGPVLAVPAPKAVIDAVQTVQVTSGKDKSGFQITFGVSKNSVLLTTMLPAGYFDPMLTRVIIAVTMGGLPTVLMDGIVTRQELSPSSEPGQSTLTITGEDLSVLMDVVECRSCAIRRHHRSAGCIQSSPNTPHLALCPWRYRRSSMTCRCRPASCPRTRVLTFST
jgi:hypothetical protein